MEAWLLKEFNKNLEQMCGNMTEEEYRMSLAVEEDWEEEKEILIGVKDECTGDTSDISE